MNTSEAEILTKNMMELSEKLVQAQSEIAFKQLQNKDHNFALYTSLFKNYLNVFGYFASHPDKFIDLQLDYYKQYLNLVNASMSKLSGEGVVKKPTNDRRFKSEMWSENAVFSFIKDSYLLTSKWMLEVVGSTEGMDKKSLKQLEFYTKQYADALSPSNFAFTNPEVIKATIESKGENLVKGLKNLITDLEKGNEVINIRQTDQKAFKVGENLATTPGKVIFRNELFELINYNPAGKEVYQMPLLLVPAWINKFYIFDLKPENSYVKWLVDKGFNVYVVSWVNPSEKHKDKSFESYMTEGLIEAIDNVIKDSGEKKVNLISYCLGGTLSAITLSYFAKKKIDKVNSVTYLTTLVDFSEAGDLSVFIDDDQLEELEGEMNKSGYLDGGKMAQVFNMLRANDLIWSFVINNYLLGKEPFPFDLLYWNSDSTSMPAKMHSFYLRNMYQKNLLCKKEALKLADVAVDLTGVKVPSYILSTREDHIAPWKSTFLATKLYKGPVKFVLSASGHVAGVINPPVKNKYCYWTIDGDTPDFKKLTPEWWFTKTKEHPGSWWDNWFKWGQKYFGDKKPSKKPGSGSLKAIADAPGTYVMDRSE